MNDRQDPLDQALAKLPREVAPRRDLWPEIRASISQSVVTTAAASSTLSHRWWQIAAAVLVVVGTPIVAYLTMRQQAPAPQAQAHAVNFEAALLPEKYTTVRADLNRQFEERIAQLSPAAREKLQADVSILRQAIRDISATLAQHPSDPLLQELLMSAYHSELQLFTDVNNLTPDERIEL